MIFAGEAIFTSERPKDSGGESRRGSGAPSPGMRAAYFIQGTFAAY